MSKATKAHSTTRRQILVAAPAVLVTGTVPAAAAHNVTPELAALIAKWKTAGAEFQRLNAIDDAARAHYHSIAPVIPERIIAPMEGDYLSREHLGHIRYCTRDAGPFKCVLRGSWWQQQIDEWKRTDIQPTYLIENARIATEFEAADEAAHEAAGCKLTNENLDAAADAVNVLEREIEDFDAQSFADLAAIARVSAVIVNTGEAIHQETWDGLIRNILSVADRQGV